MSLTVSVTKLQTFVRCRLKYWYRYVAKLRKRVRSVQLSRGSIIHSCLEAHYKGQEWTAVLTAWQQEMEREVVPFMSEKDLAEWVTLPGEVYRIVQGYLRAFAQHDKQFEVLSVEHTGHVNLPSGIQLEYRIDRELKEKETNLVFILDSKTVATIPDDKIRFTDVQTAIYAWAHGLSTGKEVAGIVWDYVRTKAPRVPEVLKKGGMSRTAIDTDWRTYRAALLSAGFNPEEYSDMKDKLAGNKFYQRVKQAKPDALVKQLVLEADYTARQIKQIHEVMDKGGKPVFTRTLLSTCSWDCEYSEICFGQLAGQSMEEQIEGHFEVDGRR